MFDCIKQRVHFLLQEGTSLMWLACESGQTNIVTVLLDNGADVNLQNVNIQKHSYYVPSIDESVSKL